MGLDTFAELRKLAATINDLQPASLGAYDQTTAIAFLKELADSMQIELGDGLCHQILAQIGWPLPFFLQLVFHELYTLLARANRGNLLRDTGKDYDAAIREYQKSIPIEPNDPATWKQLPISKWSRFAITRAQKIPSEKA